MKIKIEIWKPVKNYEGIYKISSFGNINRVWTYKENKLNPTLDGNGYYQIRLCKNGSGKMRKIHSLVAENFLNHTICGHNLVVNHKDFNKKNNHVYNLEIVTQRKNTNKKHLKSSSKFTGVCWDKQMNKWRSVIRINGKLKFLGLYKKEIEASNAYEKALNNLLCV